MHKIILILLINYGFSLPMFGGGGPSHKYPQKILSAEPGYRIITMKRCAGEATDLKCNGPYLRTSGTIRFSGSGLYWYQEPKISENEVRHDYQTNASLNSQWTCSASGGGVWTTIFGMYSFSFKLPEEGITIRFWADHADSLPGPHQGCSK